MKIMSDCERKEYFWKKFEKYQIVREKRRLKKLGIIKSKKKCVAQLLIKVKDKWTPKLGYGKGNNGK